VSKIPERKQLKRGKIYLGSQFQRFRFMVTCLLYFWNRVVKQSLRAIEALSQETSDLTAARKQSNRGRVYASDPLLPTTSSLLIAHSV
jgi:hypothetical protein